MDSGGATDRYLLRRLLIVRRWRSRLPKARRRGESELKKGDHFAAFEQPALFTQELRECFRRVRGA
jgi:pimeloyl-ACP methyl ester carboxylesterase